MCCCGRLEVVPPPMCSVALVFCEPVSDVAISCDGSAERLAAVLSDGSLAMAEAAEQDFWDETGAFTRASAWSG